MLLLPHSQQEAFNILAIGSNRERQPRLQLLHELRHGNICWLHPGNMPITLSVSLLSGRIASLEAEPDDCVGSLKRRAQTALTVGPGRLLDPSGVILNDATTLKKAKLLDGCHLTLQIWQARISSSTGEFAAILGDGCVATWGAPSAGKTAWGIDEADCRSEIPSGLRNVQHIQASRGAFAAILDDGSVVTLGQNFYGGDCTDVQDQLRNVKHIQATKQAFAAILGDGSVVTWGRVGYRAGNKTRKLKNVHKIQANHTTFAAILADGSVVTWGAEETDSSRVQSRLRDVRQIQANDQAFTAILGDGSVVTWGAHGGDSSAVQDQLRNVQQIQATSYAFAAILCDGTVVSWGSGLAGGNSEAVQHQLRNVQHIQATSGAFAAVLADGSVVTWQPERWWQQQGRARAAQGCAADPSQRWRICCHHG